MTKKITPDPPLTSKGIGKRPLFSVQPGISLPDALTYVSKLLETAELNGDEISLHTNPVERTLFWNMLHSVEVARAVVDELLEGIFQAERKPPA